MLWNKDMVMEVSVSTGYIDPYFNDAPIVDKYRKM